jgi:hypothetical protein
MRLPGLKCNYCLRAGHLEERCWTKEKDAKNGQLTPDMTSAKDTRVRFREGLKKELTASHFLVKVTPEENRTAGDRKKISPALKKPYPLNTM